MVVWMLPGAPPALFLSTVGCKGKVQALSWHLPSCELQPCLRGCLPLVQGCSAFSSDTVRYISSDGLQQVLEVHRNI